MKEIQLTKGKVALVDDEDFEVLSKRSWRLGYYNHPITYDLDCPRKTVLMHRVIMNAKKGEIIDHIDGNPLNNTRANLRFCTHAENMRNQKKPKNNTSGYKGVHLNKNKKVKKWKAEIGYNKKLIFLGYFMTPEDAARSWDAAAKMIHGAFARLNFPENK